MEPSCSLCTCLRAADKEEDDAENHPLATSKHLPDHSNGSEQCSAESPKNEDKDSMSGPEADELEMEQPLVSSRAACDILPTRMIENGDCNLKKRNADDQTPSVNWTHFSKETSSPLNIITSNVEDNTQPATANITDSQGTNFSCDFKSNDYVKRLTGNVGDFEKVQIKDSGECEEINTNVIKLENELTNKTNLDLKSIEVSERLDGNIPPKCNYDIPSSVSSRQTKVSDDVNETSRADSMESDVDGIKVGSLVDLLNPNNEHWVPLLSQISNMIRKQNDEHKQHIIMSVLIGKDFVSALELYMKMNLVTSFQALIDLEGANPRGIWSVIKTILVIIWIASDQSVNFCQYMLTSTHFDYFLSELHTIGIRLACYGDSDKIVFVVKAILGIFHNIARHVPNCKHLLCNKGAIPVIRIFLTSKIPMIRLKALMVLSYVLSEAENDIIAAGDDNFAFIHTVLSDGLQYENHKSKKFGMTVEEILCGVNNLSVNDENKIRIVKNGFLPLYEEVLQSADVREKKQGLMTLWSLAFHHFNKQKMRSMPGLMKSVFELQQCSDQEVCHAARGTYWELENTSRLSISRFPHSSVSAEDEGDQAHVMISYQWDSQSLLVGLKDRLRLAGYKIWMDVEHMTGSTLEAMALAVEKAAVVLVCMSQKYKDSPNCRTEAEYVYRLRKDFIPLRLQQDYVPDGWLGILVGTRLYFDIYTQQMVDIQLPKIVRELRNRGKIYTSQDSTDSNNGGSEPSALQRLISAECVTPLFQGQHHVLDFKRWSSQQVHDWFISIGVSEQTDELSGLDGPLLEELQVIQRSAPEYFYTLLKDFRIPPLSILKLSSALRAL